MNLPNRLTILRVCLIPVFIVFLMLDEMLPWARYAAVGVFIAACITDFFDGRIARKYNMVTNFGKFMDPLADKLLVCSALICLVYFHRISLWVVIVIVAREFIISGFRLVAAQQGLVLAASKMAKVKTAVQMIMIIVLTLEIDLPFMRVVEYVLIFASLILTIISLLEYLIKNRSVMKGEM
ncbi:MAG: CDP-diacylglycerol--glycerol-3-phosphate 3-phosphatidyltransferase [Lachnospiraceae bacterium]|nr:CDP-diacylglycerol--glycerol-3-phosphate 3-phosphatidyltransferase [Lachnospiraceae bacterium]